MTNVFDNILGLIGNTPMVKLNEVTKDIPAKVYAKIESFNPGHSTKDRIALHIIEAAERKGLLTPGATIVETTSGNTGFSIAMVSIIKGYKCILSVSDKTKPEKIAYLKALGATVYVCPASVPADDPRSYYEVAKRIAAETPNSIYINQDIYGEVITVKFRDFLHEEIKFESLEKLIERLDEDKVLTENFNFS